MEESGLEPLASEISNRSSTAKTSKGLWSSRAVSEKRRTTSKTSAEIWDQGLKETSRSNDFYSLLAEAKTANEEGSFVRALGAYREAATLARTDKAMKEAAFDYALREIKLLLSDNWRVAEAILSEARNLDPIRAVPASIATDIEKSYREETIANTLSEVKTSGDLEQSYTRLDRAIQKYPGDSNLEGSMPGISAALIDRRGPDERKKRFAYMAKLLDDLQHTTSSEDIDRCLSLSGAALGPYRSDAEIFALFGEIKLQASACFRASQELVEGHVARSLQTSSEVLHRAPQQQRLLDLRKRARDYVYPGEPEALVQIQTLFDAGPLVEAAEACKRVRVQFPESSHLAALETLINEKESSMRVLLEQGEANLLKRDLEGAGVSFQNALQGLPSDTELREHVATLLHGHARAEIDQDWRAFDATLDLRFRLLPNQPLPADLAAVVVQRKEHAEAIRQQAEAVHKTAERGLQPEFLRDSGPAAPRPVPVKLKPVKEAGVTATGPARPGVQETANRNAAPAAPPARLFDKTTITVFAAVAATLICATLLALHDHQVRTTSPKVDSATVLSVPKAAKEITSESPKDPFTVQDSKSSQLATLEVRGAEAGTEVKVDNVLLGAAVPGSSLTRELSSGDHVVELHKDGFNPKRMALHFAPGEVALLTGSNVQLQSTDAILLSLERRDWARVDHQSISGIQDFLAKYPLSAFEPAANSEIQQLEWQNVDKNEPAALQSFINRNPEHPYASKARETLQALNRQNALRLEQADWLNLNKTNKPAISAFLSKYPNGPHAASATGLFAELDEQQALLASNKREETRQAEAPVAMARGDIPRLNENRLPAASASPDAASADSAAVLDVIGRFANAWNAKDYRSIVAIEPDLNRRTLKAQLSPVKNVTMRISPVGPPQISGSEATVVCRRQADEIFVDGSLKQNPESIVTYVLAKRNGNWGILATR